MPLLAPLVLALALAVTSAPADGPPPGTWPLAPSHEVVHGFDPPADPWGAGHRGIDLLGAAGQEVHAALAGTVTFAGALAGRGVVVVDHGGQRTTYEPVAASVAVGTAVAAGAVIGHLESGLINHCFPRTCLHWGLIRRDLGGDTYLDPLSLVGGAPVRLLPLDGGVRTSARSVPPRRARPPARRIWEVQNRPLGEVLAPLAPLALVVRLGGVPGGTPRGAARW